MGQNQVSLKERCPLFGGSVFGGFHTSPMIHFHSLIERCALFRGVLYSEVFLIQEVSLFTHPSAEGAVPTAEIQYKMFSLLHQ